MIALEASTGKQYDLIPNRQKSEPTYRDRDIFSVMIKTGKKEDTKWFDGRVESLGQEKITYLAQGKGMINIIQNLSFFYSTNLQ